MPERTDNRGSGGYGEHPELLLVGADRARPLPARLRARLQAALADAFEDGTAEQLLHGEAATADAAAERVPAGDLEDGQRLPRTLSAEVRDRLESSLLQATASEQDGNVQPAPLGSAPSRRRGYRLVSRWRVASGAAVAAAVLVLVAVAVPGVLRQPHGSVNANAPAVTRSGTFGGPQRFARRVPKGKPATPGGTVPRPVRPPPSGPPQVPGVVANAAASAVVTSVSPRTGPLRGGNWVSIDGQGLVNVQSVYFGDVPAGQVRAVSARLVLARAPAHGAGTVQVKVLTRVGVARDLPAPADRYSYRS
ncbi:MAG TPA: IPT/TIG domain-containing protein [Acidimicrobiales bacterium]|nr:IPT/TIG domain-containing protein [Acidimicrobiales bacterium]